MNVDPLDGIPDYDEFVIAIDDEAGWPPSWFGGVYLYKEAADRDAVKPVPDQPESSDATTKIAEVGNHTEGVGLK